jgi:hypothetical protein
MTQVAAIRRLAWHFAAREQPQFLTTELRTAFTSLR